MSSSSRSVQIDLSGNTDSAGQWSAVLTPAGVLNELDFEVMNNPGIVAEIAAANERIPVKLRNRQVADLMEFLRALTDPASIDLRGNIPWTVPSGESLVD